MIPSLFRSALTGGTHGHKGLLGISTDALDRWLSTEQRRIRFELLSYLIEALWRAAGNIVAQQYGITSEAIDVTSSVDVAAFFATHDYPKYEHFSGDAEKPVGVIYRFPHLTRMRDLNRIEQALDEMGHIDTNGHDVWFEESPRLSQALKRNAEKVTNYFNKFGQEEATLFSPPMVIDYGMLAEPLLEALGKTWKLTPLDLQHTRLGRQAGGFIRPPVHWQCVMP